MKKISKLLSLSIALSMLCNPAIAQETIGQKGKKVYVRTIDTVVNKLQHLKGCLQGRDTCSKTDFAILGTGLLFLYGAVRSIQYGAVRGIQLKFIKNPYDKRKFLFPYLFDPAYWGEEITEVPGRIKKKIFPQKKMGKKSSTNINYTKSH